MVEFCHIKDLHKNVSAFYREKRVPMWARVPFLSFLVGILCSPGWKDRRENHYIYLVFSVMGSI